MDAFRTLVKTAIREHTEGVWKRVLEECDNVLDETTVMDALVCPESKHGREDCDANVAAVDDASGPNADVVVSMEDSLARDDALFIRHNIMEEALRRKRQHGCKTADHNNTPADRLFVDFLMLVNDCLSVRCTQKRRAYMKWKRQQVSDGTPVQTPPRFVQSILSTPCGKARKAIGLLLIEAGFWRVLDIYSGYILETQKNVARELGITRTTSLYDALHALAKSQHETAAEYTAAIVFLKRVVGDFRQHGRLQSKLTALHYAVTYHNVPAVEALLVEFPFLVNQPDEKNRTPLLRLFYEVQSSGKLSDHEAIGCLLIEHGADMSVCDVTNKNISILCRESPTALLDFARLLGRKYRLRSAKMMQECAFDAHRHYTDTVSSKTDAEQKLARVVSASRKTQHMEMHAAYAWEYAMKKNSSKSKTDLLSERQQREAAAKEALQEAAGERPRSVESDATRTDGNVDEPDKDTDVAEDPDDEQMKKRMLCERGADQTDEAFNMYKTPDEMHVEYELLNAVNTPVQIRGELTAMEIDPQKQSVFHFDFEGNSGRHLPPSRLLVHFVINESSSGGILDDIEVSDDEKQADACSEPEQAIDDLSLDNGARSFLKNATKSEETLPPAHWSEARIAVEKETEAMRGACIMIDWAGAVLAADEYGRVLRADPQTSDADVRTIVEPLDYADDGEFEYFHHGRSVPIRNDMAEFQRVIVSKEYKEKYDMHFMFHTSVTPIKAVVEDTDKNAREYIRKRLEPRVAINALQKAEEEGRHENLPDGIEPGTYEAMMHLISEDMNELDDAFQSEGENGTAAKPTAILWQFIPRLHMTISVKKRDA